MALSAGIIMTGIAIGLLALYGADIAAGLGNDGDGFLPFDHMARGIGLGAPALILPFVAYFISRKEPSRGLGAMILAAGILIIAGGAVSVINADPNSEGPMLGPAPLLVAGAVQAGIGILKIIKS